MDGIDKGLVVLEGRPMISYIIDALRPQVDSILINANRNISTYEEFGFSVISDELEDFQGPLAGMASGLRHCKTDYIATVPCDGPVLPENYVDVLMRAATRANSLISVGYDGNRLQPVYALIHRDLLSDLNEYLDLGERKIDRWYNKHQFAMADFSSSMEMFTNVNTPEDLETASELF
jgi:molybdenum cofactor guanylyltransferase